MAQNYIADLVKVHEKHTSLFQLHNISETTAYQAFVKGISDMPQFMLDVRALDQDLYGFGTNTNAVRSFVLT